MKREEIEGFVLDCEGGGILREGGDELSADCPFFSQQ